MGNSTVRGRASVEVKAIISALTTDANGSAGDLIVADRLPGILIPGQRRLTVRDLLTPGRTNSNAVQYVKETGFTNAARKTFVGAAQRNGRRLVIAMMYGLVREGGPTYWDQAQTLLDWGFAQDPTQSVATL